jgi:hypothetical protein
MRGGEQRSMIMFHKKPAQKLNVSEQQITTKFDPPKKKREIGLNLAQSKLDDVSLLSSKLCLN